jgi:phosphonate transport system permease protein
MMINIPKKPKPSLLSVLGYPFAFLFSIYSFFQIGFNLEDFRRNLQNRRLVTDPLFDPKWEWAIENATAALIETIQIAILASILGCFIALPLSFYASRATNQTSNQLQTETGENGKEEAEGRKRY